MVGSAQKYGEEECDDRPASVNRQKEGGIGSASGYQYPVQEYSQAAAGKAESNPGPANRWTQSLRPQAEDFTRRERTEIQLKKEVRPPSVDPKEFSSASKVAKATKIRRLHNAGRALEERATLGDLQEPRTGPCPLSCQEGLFRQKEPLLKQDQEGRINPEVKSQ